MSTKRRNELIRQLLGVLDENLEAFFETRRQPTFPVEQRAVRIVEAGWNKQFPWESITTDLRKLGFAFGDVVRDKIRCCYRRVIAYQNDSLWVTGDQGDIPNTIHSMRYSPDRFEKCYSRRQEIATIVNDVATDDNDAMEAIRLKLAEIPRLPTNQDGGLKLRGAGTTNYAFSWEAMTDRLTDLGLEFGDVVMDGETKYLHRVVGHNDHLWITSAESENSIACSDKHPENFEKL